MSEVDMFSLAGKTAVVTGGALGIGSGIAAAFQRAGANVLIVDVDAEAATETATNLNKGESSGEVRVAVVDLRSPEASRLVTDAVMTEFGGVDVLVNNAGVYPVVEFDDLSVEDYEATFQLNVRAVLFLTQALNKVMRPRGGGSIINLGSMDAFRPNMPGLAHYGASKGSIIALTKHLAVGLAPHQIRVNAIVPGGITTSGSARLSEGTQMTEEQRDALIADFAARVPLGRLGTPQDFAGPAVFLASAASRYVTGAVLTVDGGLILV
jgi:NAD(P)-dependent dehydrogenase (short-subunit alcohol dehydrogenase family)